MDVWNNYVGKKVFLILKNKRRYEGNVLEIDNSNPLLIWMVLLDKLNHKITFLINEIELIQEEE